MTPAADYARAVYALSHPALPAYVSFVTGARAYGIAGDSDPAHTVYVRTKDGAVVSGDLENFSTAHYQSGGGSDNPVSKPAFAPGCYAATDEQRTVWEKNDVLRISLRTICPSSDPDDPRESNPFDAIYVDPVTLQPLGVTGTIDAQGVSVDLEEHFARFGAYTYASDLSAHVRGHGLLFWVRERAAVTYSDYRTYASLPKGIERRQASATP